MATRNSRVVPQAEVIKAPGLRPSAAPTDTYARPEAPEVSNDPGYRRQASLDSYYTPAPQRDYETESLIQGLSQLNPALARFGATAAEHVAKDQRESIPDTYAKVAAGKTPEEARKAALEHPVLRSAMAQQYWGRMNVAAQADQDALDREQWYQTEFDKANGDLDRELRDYAGKRVNDLGLDARSGAAAAYLERLGAVGVKLKSQQQAFKVQETQARQQSMTQDGILSQVRTVIDAGKPEEAPARVAEILRTNAELNRLPYKEQQKWLLDAVDRLHLDMDRDPANRAKTFQAIKAVLDAPRAGADGVPRRLTEAVDGVGEAAQRTLAVAERKYRELNDKFAVDDEARFRNQAQYEPHKFDPKALAEYAEKNPGAIAPAKQGAILQVWEAAKRRDAATAAEYEADRQAKQYETQAIAQAYGRFTRGDWFDQETVQLPTKGLILSGGQAGEYRAFTPQQQKAAVFAAFKEDLDRERAYLLNRGQSPEAVNRHLMAKELATYSLNGMVPDSWKEEMQAGLRQATNAILSGKNPPEGSARAFARYKLLKEKAPNLIPEVTTPDTKAFYDMAEVAAQYGYPDEASQLLIAGQYFNKRQNDPDKEKVSLRAVRDTVEGMKPGTFGSLVAAALGKDSLDNAALMKDKVARFATMLHFGMGLEPEEAIKQAAKRVKHSFAVVNGWAVDINDKRLGPDFENRAERYLAMVFDQAGSQLGIKDRRDLILVPMGDQPDAFIVMNKRNGAFLPSGAKIKRPSGQEWSAAFMVPQVLREMDTLMRDKAAVKAHRMSEERLDPPLVLGPDTYMMPLRWHSVFGDGPAFTLAEEAEVDRRAKARAEKNRRNPAPMPNVDPMGNSTGGN